MLVVAAVQDQPLQSSRGEGLKKTLLQNFQYPVDFQRYLRFCIELFSSFLFNLNLFSVDYHKNSSKFTKKLLNKLSFV